MYWKQVLTLRKLLAEMDGSEMKPLALTVNRIWFM